MANRLGDVNYLLVVVPRQTGGPFAVAPRAETDRKINLKSGRYVRIEADTRLARPDEEYDLLRKFLNFHFSSIASVGATINDLDIDLLREYVSRTSVRRISEEISSKQELCKILRLTDKNDPADLRVKNYAVLMFSDNPEKLIPYACTELVIDMFGTKRKMESKMFTGPVWKQYYQVLEFLNSNFLSELVLREKGRADNRKVANFTFVAVEELLANALVRNNYENGKPVQVYISEKQINIVNYNKPLPPLRLSDLNERTFFNERDTENPELRDMFKALGIIESFGTGIGEAKRSLMENKSPDLYYKVFDANDNVTSVVIPVNEEYFRIKHGLESGENPADEINQSDQFQTADFNAAIQNSGYSKNIIANIIKLHEAIGIDIFGNSVIAEILGCSEVTASSYIRKMHEDMKVITAVTDKGKGKYRFCC